MAPILKDFIPLEIGHRPQFQELLEKYPPQISEHTFTNLFIWRNIHSFEWTRSEDWIALKAKDSEGRACFWTPLGGGGDAGEIVSACMEIAEAEKFPGPRMVRVPENIAGAARKAGFAAEPDRDNFDYVYRSKDLIELAGRYYHSKKNHLNKFRKKYSWTYESLGGNIIQECLNMQEEWCDFRQCHLDPGLAGEERAVWDALNNMDSLNFSGGVIRVDGKIEAFSLGEKLNDNTAVIHIEKANPEIDGLYTAINQAYVERELASYEFINREQDLGAEGLRRAKESYKPIKMVEKFILRGK